MSELNAMSWWNSLTESQRAVWKERVKRPGRRVAVVSAAYRLYNRQAHAPAPAARPVAALVLLLAITFAGTLTAHAMPYRHARAMYHKVSSAERSLPGPALDLAVTQAGVDGRHT